MIRPDHEECRIYGHAWDTTGVAFLPKYIEETLECMRCETIRISNLARKTGLLIGSPRYKYPEGYLQKGKKFGRNERGQLRANHLKGKS